MQRLAALEEEQQRLRQQGAVMHQAMSDQSARADRAEAALQQMQQERAAAATGQFTGQVVDTRTLGKPKTFGGAREQWLEFRFVFEAFAAAAHPGMDDLMRRAEISGSVRVDLTTMSDEQENLGKQLYYMLVLLVSDDALRLVRTVEKGNGAEASEVMVSHQSRGAPVGG